MTAHNDKQKEGLEKRFWVVFIWLTWVIWLVSWLLAVWVNKYAIQLVITGFFMILCNYGGNMELEALKKRK